MNKFMLRLTQILSILMALTAMVFAIVGILTYLKQITKQEKRYTEFPPEYDDYADWELD